MTRKVLRSFASLLMALAFALAGFSPALAAPPSNDDFVNATIIGALPFSDSVDNTQATLEAGESFYCNYSPQTVWYSFTATSDAVLRADMTGSSFSDTNLVVYRDGGGGIGSLSFLQCAYPDSPAIFNVQAGITYYLQAGNIYSGGGDLHVNLQEIPTPPNDNFDSATIIGMLPFNDSVDITAALREPDEPHNCYDPAYTVWYSFTPAADVVIRADMAGSSFSDNNLNIYQAAGPGFSGLSFLNCAYFGGSVTFSAQAGITYYLQAGRLYNGGGDLHVNLQEIPPPANDDFANAMSISALPFSLDFDTGAATFESGEPSPACGNQAPPYRTIWFAFTASQDGSISASVPSSGFSSVLAAYTGSGLGSLTQLACGQYSNKVTFHAVQGHTYYLQVGGDYGQGGSGTLLLENAPAPQASFYFYPGDPSKYDTVQFCDNSYDPGNAGFQSFAWDFGDGATSTGGCSAHRYAADGGYTVQHGVTTMDGRTASTSQVVQVRTHDVGITKVAAPQSASAGQTRTITVSVRNLPYPETVRVDLYKSTASGELLIGTLTLQVPVLTGNKTKQFAFNYTFTSQDAQLGKVTFRAVATIEAARDAYPQDNTGISSPPTRVTR